MAAEVIFYTIMIIAFVGFMIVIHFVKKRDRT